MVGMRYTIYHWATNRSDPQNLLSITLDVPLQGGRTCDKYIQEFKKVTRRSSYKGRLLIKEFKKELNGNIRRKLAKAEEPPTTIGKWQERAIRLDRNQR